MEGLAQKSLSAGPRALRDSTALMLEEAARMNGPRSARHSKGVTWMEETPAASRRIAWLSLAASVVAFFATGFFQPGPSACCAVASPKARSSCCSATNLSFDLQVDLDTVSGGCLSAVRLSCASFFWQKMVD